MEQTAPTRVFATPSPRADATLARLQSIAQLAAHALDAPVATVWLTGSGWRCVCGDAPDALTAVAPLAQAAALTGCDAVGAAGDFHCVAVAALRDVDGAPFGALCVLDRRRRRLSQRRLDVLRALARLASSPTAVDEPAPPGAEERRMRARFEAIFENTDASVFIKQRSGALLAANGKYRRMAGRDDVVGRTDLDLYGLEIGRALRERDAQIFATGVAFTGEERVVFANGEEVIYLSSKFLIYDAALDDQVLCGIATDITAQKRLQASLEQSRREAEEANAAKAKFLAAVSHELRTPMNGVMGMLALLEATDLDPRQRSLAQVARDSAADLLAILNDIIDFARVGAPDFDFARAPFDLRGALRAVIAPARARALKKGVTLTLSVDRAAPQRVLGDQTRFRQIIANLLSNAVKFTDAGAIAVTVAPGPQGMRVTVADTGVGVAAEAQARIFGGFSQADGSPTRRYGGLGLGLSIGKRLVEGMGGTIGVDSVEGQGATFWFVLPLPAVEGA